MFDLTDLRILRDSLEITSSGKSVQEMSFGEADLFARITHMIHDMEIEQLMELNIV
jgi:hypothetical protein